MSKDWIQLGRQDKLAPVRGDNLSLPSTMNFDVADEITLADAWILVRKRRLFILSFVIAVVIATGAYNLAKTPRYEATARIAISPEGPDGLNLDSISGGSLVPRDTSTKLETEVRILESDSLGLQLLHDLKLGRQQLRTGNADPEGYTPEISPKQQAKLLRMYQDNLSVKVVPKTQVVEIRFRNPNPELAAKVANTLVNDYMERGVKTKFESTKQVSDWLAKQLDELKTKTQDSQERLAAFQRENGIIGDEKNNIVTERLKQLNEQLTAAEADRILKEAKYRLASSRDPELIAAVVPTSALQLLRAQQVEIRNQYTQASAKFGAGYPKVGELQTQLAQVNLSIQNEVQNAAGRIENEYLAAQKAEALLRANFDQQKQKAYELNGNAVQYGLLKREVDSSRDLYEGLLRKLKEAGISAGLKSTQVNIVDAATIPAEPVEPNMPVNFALALAGGLLGGIVLCFVLESLDDSVHTVEQSEAVSSLPSLAMIPKFKATLHGKNGHAQLPSGAEPANRIFQVLSLAKPNSQVAESYRTLRSSILLSAATPPKVLVVTSSMPEEGKTTTSLNCAVVLAQKGARVLLLDGDIRRPAIHEVLGLKNETGLSTVLRGGDDVLAMVSLDQLPNLKILSAGPRCPYPAELLGSDRMRELLAKWRTEYDHIVIDTPPVSTVTDATILGAQADAVLLVIRCGQTRKQTLRRTRDLLLRINANIAGVVVNAVDITSPEYYGYYGTGHYYGKGNGNGYYYDNENN